jgi:hypothetical protein
LLTHQPPCLLHERPSAVHGLQRLSQAVFVAGGSIGTIEDNVYSGFDDNILPDAGVDMNIARYQGS